MSSWLVLSEQYTDDVLMRGPRCCSQPDNMENGMVSSSSHVPLRSTGQGTK